MWRDNITARQLREAFPEIALNLETEQLRHELQSLGLIYSIRRNNKSAAFEIALKPSHLLRIQPTDRSQRNTSEWLSWHQNCNSETPILDYSIRAAVTVTDLSDDGRAPYTITIHEDGIEQIIRCVIANYKFSTGIDITPRTKVRNR
jgi:hypothetical protein